MQPDAVWGVPLFALLQTWRTGPRIVNKPEVAVEALAAPANENIAADLAILLAGGSRISDRCRVDGAAEFAGDIFFRHP